MDNNKWYSAWKAWLGFGAAITLIGIGRLVILRCFSAGSVSQIRYMLGIGVLLLLVGGIMWLRSKKDK